MRISDWSSDVCSSDLPGFLQIARPFAAGREKIDLKDEHVVLRRLDDIFERGVRHEPAVPIPDAIELDRRPAGRQRARGEDVARVEALALRTEEHTSELQSLMRIPYAVFCLKKKKQEKYCDNQ